MSTDAVKQRLSRGRRLLRDRLAVRTEAILKKTRPGAAFTVCVLAALPAVLPPAGAAATLAAAAAKGGGVGKGVLASAWIGAIAGPVLGILGGWVGYRASMNAAQSYAERDVLRQMSKRLMGLIAFFGCGLGGLIWIGIRKDAWQQHPATMAVLLTAIILVYCGGLVALILVYNRRLNGLRTEPQAHFSTGGSHANSSLSTSPAQTQDHTPNEWEYRTSSGFLGLPWIHIRGGSLNTGKASWKPPLVGSPSDPSPSHPSSPAGPFRWDWSPWARSRSASSPSGESP